MGSGVGWAQFCSTIALMTYYSSLMSLTLFFLVASFSAELPWSKCREEWGHYCIDSGRKANTSADSARGFDAVAEDVEEQYRSSAELYFL